jgi:hypothetical protein
VTPSSSGTSERMRPSSIRTTIKPSLRASPG